MPKEQFESHKIKLIYVGLFLCKYFFSLVLRIEGDAKLEEESKKLKKHLKKMRL
jgi:hypothetical protein